MEISWLKLLLNNITSFFSLTSENIDSEPIQRYYHKVEEILTLLKPIFDAAVDLEVTSDDPVKKQSEEFADLVYELKEIFETWHPLMSKVYFVLQLELLISKCQTCALEILLWLQSCHQSLPAELSSSSIEPCIQKLKLMGHEETSHVLNEAIKDEAEGARPSSDDSMVEIAEFLNLLSNQDLLIEAVALVKLKETADQSENNVEAEHIDKMITLVTNMHDHLITLKQSQSCSPIPIPADFCCPLSLELMTDPVIVASGQTYERAFIKNWISLGLTVCPKTRQPLSHANLIPNYTVKALIVNWCESNNVKLPDPVRSGLNESSPLLGSVDSGATRDSHVSRPRSHQPMSPEPTRAMSLPGKNPVASSGIHHELTSPSHPRSSSEGSLSSVMGNGHALGMERVSLSGYEEEARDSEERFLGSGRQPSLSPSRKEFSHSEADAQSFQSHKRASSASSTLSSVDHLQGTAGDANEVLQVPTYPTAYSGDASGEVKSEPQPSASLPTQPRELEFPRRLEVRSRSQSIWRRPSERYVPRIVPSPAIETRPDLSGIETQVRKLVEDLKSSSVDTQRGATEGLRLLAKHNMDNRIVIANCGAINLLVNLLLSEDQAIQENAVTALLNLSINDNNKTAIANAGAIEPLIRVLERGTAEAKENSAATLFSLSVIEDNKISIGRSGAIGPLVDLLGNGTPRGKKDAATALFNLSIFHENKPRIVEAGAVKHLVELMDPAAGMVDKAVAVLANLATINEGRTEIGQQGGIPVLVEVVELGSARGKENAAAALLQLCTHNGRFCNMVLQEGAVPPLVALSQSGTPRAKEKAQQLLNCFRNQRHATAGRG